MLQMAAAAFFHEDWAVVIWEFLGFIFITLCLQYEKDYYLCKTKDNIWKPRRNC